MTLASILPALVALFAGAVLAIQPGINGVLASRLQHPIQASVVSFTVGWCLILTSCVVLGQRLPRPGMLTEMPWWVWCGGGLIGAFFVTAALIVAPKIGATYWVALIVAGQMLTSLFLDHHGWLGFARQHVTWPRILGAALIVVGVLLISWRGRAPSPAGG